MFTKVVFLLALFGVSSSTLPEPRICDPEPKQRTPTVCSNYKNIEYLEEKQMKLQKRIDAMEDALNSLKTEDKAKVAFSATVIESQDVFTGPATTSTALIFNHVFTNIGNAYNSKTGIFTAPVKGVYHFSFTTFGYNSHTSGAILLKNGHYQVSTWESTGPDASDTTSNTVILELSVGETVNIALWNGGKVHASVFSGFLVFPTS